MTAITAFLLGTLAASPAVREEISMDCLTAVNRALHYIGAEQNASDARSSGDASGSSDAVEARYDRARCMPSNVVPGRIYVSLSLKGVPLYRSHTYYVVDSSGEVTVQRSMPCSEYPTACQ